MIDLLRGYGFIKCIYSGEKCYCVFGQRKGSKGVLYVVKMVHHHGTSE